MPIHIKRSYIVGLVLTALGCFLPWQGEGDFLYYWTIGVRVFPKFEDNGGVLVLLLCTVLFILIFRPPAFLKLLAKVTNLPYSRRRSHCSPLRREHLYNRFIEGKQKWAIAIGGALVLDSAFQICIVLIKRSKAGGIVGAPAIHFGLIMVSIGSVILLITSLLHFRKSSHQK